MSLEFFFILTFLTLLVSGSLFSKSSNNLWFAGRTNQLMNESQIPGRKFHNRVENGGVLAKKFQRCLSTKHENGNHPPALPFDKSFKPQKLMFIRMIPDWDEIRTEKEFLFLESPSKPVDPFKALESYLAEKKLDEIFVSRSLIIDGVNYGPKYCSLLSIKKSATYSFPRMVDYLILPKLDFGTSLDHLDISPYELQRVNSMKESLVKKEIFNSDGWVFIEKIIVNEINYGSHRVFCGKTAEQKKDSK